MTDIQLKQLKDNLWHSADLLRQGAHLAANKFGQPILGLVFLRYADILFKQHKADILSEYESLKGGRREKTIKEISVEKIGFFIPECAYFDTINEAPDTSEKATLVKRAMEEIEKENPRLEGVLPKDVYAQLVPEEEPDLLSKIIRVFKDIPEDIEIDLFGEIYEYFLGNFALSEGKDGGTFYTPASVVRYMVQVLNPETGDKKFLDPACGSGGMFVQAARYMHKHFINRGYKGKGMVVSIDKFTAVTMYDKVQRYWLEEQKNLIKRRNDATEEEKKKIQETLDYMKTVEMAVVISEESDEVEKFQAKGLDITSHRKKMNEITPEGHDIEDRFRDPNDPLQLVFVCAMWLTGFDVPSLSTLYLDKPMKGHTLMQCIARANRCFEGKKCGLIVDYVNVFKWMKEALGSYAVSPDNPEMPVKDIESLLTMLEESITMTSDFLAGEGIRIEEAFNEESLDKLDIIRKQYDRIVEKDDVKNKFKVLSNTMINLYEASKPEVFERHWTDTRFAALKYLHDLFDNTVNDEKLERAKEKMGALLNQSVSSNVLCEDKPNYGIKGSKVIDLSKLDVKDLEKELKDAEYKSVEIENLREFIEKTLQQMINRNTTRVSFSERYQGIINRYNAGSTESEDYYEQLLQLIEDLKKENDRAYEQGLTEEELEIYDLLVMGKHLTKAEDQKVKLAAKHLYDTLLTKKAELMVIEWYKDEQTKALVRDTISAELDKDLPDAYDKDSFNSKTNLLLNHFMDMSVQGYGWVA